MTLAEEKKTIYEIAQGYGYKPRQSSPATVTLDVYQTVPARTDIEDSAGRRPPNEDYCVNVTAGMKVTSQNGTLFRTVDDVVFGDSSSMSPREESIAEIDDEQNNREPLMSISSISDMFNKDSSWMDARNLNQPN